VVGAIVKALTARKPATRYIVGREAWMGLRILLRLPARLRDRVLMSSLGLGPGSFERAGASPKPEGSTAGS